MSNAITLTGRWVGDYTQHSRSSPISAEFEQSGEALKGTMRDGVTDRDQSVFEVAAEAGLHPGADEQITAQIRELFPESPTAPIRFVSHLPEKSRLEGSFKPPTVYFLKTYQGSHSSGYKVGEALVVSEVPSHCVHYRGKLSADGLEIDGKWWIDADPERHTSRNEGFFTLRRQG